MSVTGSTVQISQEELKPETAFQESSTKLLIDDSPEDGIFVLPGGYVDENGVAHFEVELAPVTGNEEEFLATLPTGATAAKAVTGLLVKSLKRVGSLEEIGSSLVRDLLVGDRDFLMIKLREMTLGNRIDAIVHCFNLECRKPMDVILYTDELQFERKAVSSRFFNMELSSGATMQDVHGEFHRLVNFRLPTGADQEAIASLFRMDETQAENCLFSRCITRVGKCKDIDKSLVAMLPPQAMQEIEEEMARLAPPVEIVLEGVCPECGEQFLAPLDFISFFFSEMRTNLRQLEREVHLLALHYHWSEKDILSLSRRKRHRYLALLREELERYG